MEAIDVHQRLRPIRYAFLITSGDQEAALTAAAVNTVLWGGLYNPIIPATPAENASLLIRAFDPDYLINLSATNMPDDMIQDFDERIISREGLVRGKEERGRRITIGFSIGPVLWTIKQQELGRGANSSHAAILRKIPGEWLLYAAYSFGDFTHLPDIGVDMANVYVEMVSATEIDFTLDAHDYGACVFPIDATTYSIRSFGGSGSFSSHIVYVGDHRNLEDLIEFWNIRSTGRRVLFVPVGNYAAHRAAVERAIKAGHYKINVGYENATDVVKSASVTKEGFDAVIQWARDLNVSPFRVSPHGPRFGLNIDWYVGDINVSRLEASESEETTLLDGERLTPVKAIKPPFLDDDQPPYSNHWAVEISLHHPRSNDTLMTRLPKAPGMQDLLRRHTLVVTSGKKRLADHCIVIFPHMVRDSISLFPAPTFNVFKQLFEHATGLAIQQSNPGRFAERIIQKMGGLQFGCRVFKIHGIREIFHRLSGGATLQKGEMQGIYKSRANWSDEMYRLLWVAKDCAAQDFHAVFDFLLEKQLMRPGLILKCDHCLKEDWYHVSQFEEEYRCRYCFDRQRVKFGSVRQWEYKSDGLLQIPKSAEGSLAVIVALWRINEVHPTFGKGRFVTGLNLCRDNGEVDYELDFAFLDMDSRDGPYDLILGEAKAFVDYEESNLERLAQLSTKFAGNPFLAIATLKDQFSDPEKAALRKLVEQKFRLLPLTRRELDPYDLFSRLESAPHKYPVSFSELSKSLVSVNLPG